MQNDIYNKRITNLQKAMLKSQTDLVIVTPSTNLRYLTGYSAMADERLLLLIVPCNHNPFFVAPKLYCAHIQDTPIEEVYYWNDQDNPYDFLLKILKDKKLTSSKVLVENKISGSFLLPIQKLLPKSAFSLASELFTELRIIKDKTEIELLSKSGSITDSVLDKVINNGNWVGKTERQLALALEIELKNSGMEDLAFKTIVGSGPNSAIPHHSTGDRIISENEPLVVDFGGIFKGYCSDITRTFCLGNQSSEFKEIYSIVKKANETAIKTIKPNIMSYEIDQVARNIIEEAGYGDYFIHRTGHGIGMDVHEEPYIVKGSQQVLKPGMTFSVEPGIYIQGKLGVRLEDQVLVTENGYRTFNNFPKY